MSLSAMAVSILQRLGRACMSSTGIRALSIGSIACASMFVASHLKSKVGSQLAVSCMRRHSISATSAAISRVMLPDDANPAGNVHGGTILQMIDEAGWATATKYFNGAQKDQQGTAALARIERVDFVQPMFIGEVAKLHAEVTYTSEHSIEVTVNVTAENVLTGTERLTNTARLWYIVKATKEINNHRSFLERYNEYKSATLAVPPMEYATTDAEEAGLERYNYQRKERNTRKQWDTDHPIENKEATLIHVMLPSDCYSNGMGQAGAVLKLMDTAAGVVTVQHCRSNAVTASLEAVDFVSPVFNGNLIEIHAYPIFTSSRSMDVEVNVYTLDHFTTEKRLATRSVFTFVALDENRRPKQVPQLEVVTEAQKVRFHDREEKYKLKKQKRKQMQELAKAEAQQAKEQQQQDNKQDSNQQQQ